MTGSELTTTASDGRFPQMGRGLRVATVLIGAVMLGWLISWANGASPERAALILHLALGGLSATASLIGGWVQRKRLQSAILQGLGINDTADRASAVLAGVASFVEIVTAGLAGSIAHALAAAPGGNFLIVRRSRLILLPVTVAGIAALLLWLVVTGVTGSADIRIFFVLFVANVWARQVRNLIGLSSLPAMLRQAPGSPHF